MRKELLWSENVMKPIHKTIEQNLKDLKAASEGEDQLRWKALTEIRALIAQIDQTRQNAATQMQKALGQ